MAELLKLPIAGSFFLMTLLGVIHGSRMQAQSLSMQTSLPAPPVTQISTSMSTMLSPLSSMKEEARLAYDRLPDAPGVQVADATAGKSISGTVTDVNGAEIAGAQVTLLSGDSKFERILMSDGEGYFNFAGVEPGTYKLTILSKGFSTWVSAGIELREGESYDVPNIILRVAVANTNVDVVLSQYDVAEEQVKTQEGQRVLGVFPNFYVSYVWNAAPLTAGQKFRLALRNEADPVSFLGAAFGAGVEQWQEDYRGYGEGAKGYFTRMGASYGDGFNSVMIAGAILPSILHQDPRYFYRGTGTKRSRVLYAISTVFICKGDSGRWQPNYSNVFGNLAAAGISNAYYPSANRGARLTIDNTLLGFAASAAQNLFQLFLVKKISRGVKQP